MNIETLVHLRATTTDPESHNIDPVFVDEEQAEYEHFSDSCSDSNDMRMYKEMMVVDGACIIIIRVGIFHTIMYQGPTLPWPARHRVSWAQKMMISLYGKPFTGH